MNLAPANPTFIQARDAIILAHDILYGGYDKDRLWAGFAKRGVGSSAGSPSSSTTYGVVESFDVAPPGPDIWTYQVGGAINSSPAVGYDGAVYFGAEDGKLYAINSDGSERWDVLLSPGNDLQSSPTVGPDGAIYVGTSDGKLYAVNADGTVKWSFTTGGAIYCSPAIGTDGAAMENFTL